MHVDEQALPIEKFEVFALNMPHHLHNVVVAAGVEHFAIAEAADRALRVRVDAENWHAAILDHARRLQESAIAAQRQNQFYPRVSQVLFFQLMVLFHCDLSPALLECLDHLVCNCDVDICSFSPG